MYISVSWKRSFTELDNYVQRKSAILVRNMQLWVMCFNNQDISRNKKNPFKYFLKPLMKKNRIASQLIRNGM